MFRVDFLKTVYFRRGLTCILVSTNDLIDGGLHKVKPNNVLKPGVFSPRLATVYQVVQSAQLHAVVTDVALCNMYVE